MKVIEQAEELVERLRYRAAAAEREATRLKGLIADIPEDGEWVPLRLKVSVINDAVTLEEERAYIVKNEHGQTLSLWTSTGWLQVNEMPSLKRLTHVWLPIKE